MTVNVLEIIGLHIFGTLSRCFGSNKKHEILQSESGKHLTGQCWLIWLFKFHQPCQIPRFVKLGHQANSSFPSYAGAHDNKCSSSIFVTIKIEFIRSELLNVSERMMLLIQCRFILSGTKENIVLLA